jgi:hypothetical protein
LVENGVGDARPVDDFAVHVHVDVLAAGAVAEYAESLAGVFVFHLQGWGGVTVVGVGLTVTGEVSGEWGVIVVGGGEWMVSGSEWEW